MIISIDAFIQMLAMVLRKTPRVSSPSLTLIHTPHIKFLKMRNLWLGHHPFLTRHSYSPSTIVCIIVILLTEYPRKWEPRIFCLCCQRIWYCWWSINIISTPKNFPKARPSHQRALVFCCACLARASWLFASQVTRQSSLCIDMFTRSWEQCAEVLPYLNACHILRARLVRVFSLKKKNSWQEILTTALGRRLAKSLSVRRSGSAWPESKRWKFEIERIEKICR